MRRMLIVDDEESTLVAMQEYFESLGCEVEVALDARQAEKKLRSGTYAVIITDLRLHKGPNADGLDVVQSARSRFPRSRIVVLTAVGSGLENIALRRGADAFVYKPMSLALLARLAFPPTEDEGGSPDGG